MNKITRFLDKLTATHKNPVVIRQRQISAELKELNAINSRLLQIKEELDADSKLDKKIVDGLMNEADGLDGRYHEIMDRSKKEYIKSLGSKTKTDEQNRLLVASTIIALDVGLWAIGKSTIAKYLGHHIYTAFLSQAVIYVPTISAVLALAYVLCTGASLKYKDKDYLGIRSVTSINVIRLREALFDSAIDMFGYYIVIDITILLSLLIINAFNLAPIPGFVVIAIVATLVLRWIASNNYRSAQPHD